MFLKPRSPFSKPLTRLGAWLLCGACGVACGARTEIYTSDAGVQAPIVCVADVDCATGDACAPAECREGVCSPLPPTVCDDQNECTANRCDPDSGQCSFAPLTMDLDGDGHASPRPGFAPGSPGSCGDDCDDRSAAAHPGGVEACDGVDNDCNGKVDDNAVYGALTPPVRVSSAEFDRANGTGLAFDGTNYGVSFSGHQQLSSSYFLGLSGNAAFVVPQKSLADINSETYGGPLVHNGSYFESVWADARQAGNYEVYFNRFDSNGNKLGPDLRVTRASGFSLNPSVVWNGTESLLVWNDSRLEGPFQDDPHVFAQRIAFDGTLVGDNVQIASPGTRGENPGIALGTTRVGIAFAARTTGSPRTAFLTTAPDLSDQSSLVDLGGTDVEGPGIVSVAGRFVVAWQTKGGNYGPSIYGAVVDESGGVVVPARPITSGASFARSFSLVSLGDRVVLVWADDHDGNYELYQEILDEKLDVLSNRTRLSFTLSDTLSPIATLGPKGDLAVLYEDWQSGSRQTYFLSMSCAMPSR